MNPKISIIVAMDSNRGIGKGDRLVWKIRDDLIRLKELTKDRVVIIGRKSYQSMAHYYDKSGRPMPAKYYVVITHNPNFTTSRDNYKVADGIENAIKIAEHEKELFVIGGAAIFKLALPFTTRIYLTLVQGQYEVDSFFPDYSNFKKIISQENRSSGDIDYQWITLEK